MDREGAESSFERLAAVQSGYSGVGRRTMFGRDGLTVNGRFFAFRDKDRLLLKLPRVTRDALLAEGHAISARSVSPTMTTWVAVPYGSRAVDWSSLTDQAREFVARASGEPPGSPEPPAPSV